MQTPPSPTPPQDPHPNPPYIPPPPPPHTHPPLHMQVLEVDVSDTSTVRIAWERTEDAVRRTIMSEWIKMADARVRQKENKDKKTKETTRTPANRSNYPARASGQTHITFHSIPSFLFTRHIRHVVPFGPSSYDLYIYIWSLCTRSPPSFNVGSPNGTRDGTRGAFRQRASRRRASRQGASRRRRGGVQMAGGGGGGGRGRFGPKMRQIATGRRELSTRTTSNGPGIETQGLET